MSTILAQEHVITLEQDCHGSLSNVLDVAPLKTNGILGLVLSFFSLIDVIILKIHRFNHVDHIIIIRVHIVDLDVRLFFQVLSFFRIVGRARLVIQVLFMSIHNYMTIVD